jgi:hypothetical protein
LQADVAELQNASQEGQDTPPVAIEKSGNTVTITQGKSIYTLKLDVSESRKLSTWRLIKQTINGDEIWKDIDIEAPIKQKDTADFIGGYHGDEYCDTVSMYADGEPLDLAANWTKLTANVFTVFVTSKVNYCDTDTKAFTRHKKLEFTTNKLTVYNVWEYVGTDDFVVLTNCGGGMWSIYCDLIHGYSSNVDCSIKNNAGTSGGTLMNEVTIYGKSGFVTTVKGLTAIDEEHYMADVSYFGSDARPRIKPYFMTVYNSKPKTLKTGDKMASQFSIEIQ